MITINTDIFDLPEIEKIYQQAALASKVKSRMEAHLKVPNPENADRIVTLFLRKHFLDDQGGVSQDKITDYLLCREPVSMILSFWGCVSRVWTEKLLQAGRMTQITERYGEMLSRWNGVREQALDTKCIADRVSLVTKVITPEVLPFYDNIELKDLDEKKSKGTVVTNLKSLKEVRFRYHNDIHEKKTGALAMLADIFDYDFLNGSPRHELLAAMHIPVCPYCNRQYITRYKDGTEKKITADLDHFFCKSQYPYLALSVFNFVPSCQICNSRFKLAVDFHGIPHLHPYKPKPGSGLTFKLTDPRLLLDEDAWKRNADVVTLIPTDDAARNSKRTFRLEEIYQIHKDYVHETVLKARIYNDDRIAALRTEFSDIFETEKEIRNLAFGQFLDEEDMYRRPLAKLTQDLLKKDSGQK